MEKQMLSLSQNMIIIPNRRIFFSDLHITKESRIIEP